MAIPYKEVYDKLTKEPLSNAELASIAEVEAFIDAKIEAGFRGDPMRIELNIADFSWNPISKMISTNPTVRKKLMQRELEDRYRSAGWRIDTEIGEGLASGYDYWILEGAK